MTAKNAPTSARHPTQAQAQAWLKNHAGMPRNGIPAEFLETHKGDK